jgi:hypothetical protein
MKKTATITALAGAALVAGYLVLAPAPAPRSITLLWDDTNGNAGGAATFNIYSSREPRLSTMWLVTNVATTSVTLAATNAAEFFGVKALRNGLESDWAEVAR